MRQTKTVPRVMFTCATVLVMAIASAYAGTDRNPEDDHAWFVHVTDPHFFLDRPGDTDAAKESTREKQEKLNQNALSDLWKQIPSIPHGDHPLAFVVLTGDFGVEPCSIATNPQAKPKAKDCIDNVNKEKRAGQITVLADLLGSSPIRDIYLVAGDKDIPSETAADCGLVYFH